MRRRALGAPLEDGAVVLAIIALLAPLRPELDEGGALVALLPEEVRQRLTTWTPSAPTRRA
jgi:hypothetical protein